MPQRDAESAPPNRAVGEQRGSEACEWRPDPAPWPDGIPPPVAEVVKGGNECDGSSPTPPVLTPPPDPPPPLRNTLVVFLRFFHLARRFWNQTCNVVQQFGQNDKLLRRKCDSFIFKEDVTKRKITMRQAAEWSAVDVWCERGAFGRPVPFFTVVDRLEKSHTFYTHA